MTPDFEETLRRQIELVRANLGKLPEALRGPVEKQIAEMTARLGDAGDAARPVLAAVLGHGTGNERYLPYRGDLKAGVGVGGTLAFVTAHPEGLPTALYRLDADRLSLQADPLPCGGVAIAADGNTIYIGGTDRRVYEVAGKKAPRPLGQPFAGPVAALLPVAKKRIAVLNGNQIDIVSDADGAVLQTLELPEDGTCLAADKTGAWLVAGTTRGTVAVFDGQDKDEFELSEAEKLHDGAVTALLFEPEELRFFSAGADNKLLTTFARGRLEPEDKGRANTHEDLLTAMVLVPGDRFVTGSRDATLKNWPRVGGVKPTTLKEGCGKVVALATVTVYNQLHVTAFCGDNSIRLFKLEADGRFGDEPGPRVYGAADWVKNELAQTHDPKRREKALKTLAEWKDSASIDILGEQVDKDPDHQLRLLAAQLLSASDNPRVGKILEKAISHGDGKVRVQAFQGLFKPLKPDFGPIDLALKTGHADVSTLAVKALEPLAKTDDQALTRLTDALNAPSWDVRKAALASLEAVFPKTTPQASLTALTSKHGDLRAAALTRAFERGLLGDPAVQSALRRRLEDEDTGVRKVAFLLSVVAHPHLAGVLRAADAELNRQVNELEKAEKPDRPAPAMAVDAKTKLTPADYDVLLQATASRALDTCLRGARGLAVLGDPRAFGLLLQLSREDDTHARVEVCRALAALDDERAVNRLRSLLFDKEPSVRDAAYTALLKIFDTSPLSVAEAGLTAADEDVRRRGLETLVQFVRKQTPNAAGDPGWELLVRALNDSAAGVRGETFKAVLNLKIAGGGPDTLRFVLQSIHPDVRREALTEITAQEKEEWATPLLYEFFNDPDAGLRAEAFGFATKKNKDVGVLEIALGSRYPDARKLAVDGLIKKHSKAAQQVLLRAIADPDREVRLLAITALVDDDAKGPLTEALGSPLPDIRVRAAAALARHGDPAALAPLRELATAPEPQLKDRVPDWREAAELALDGLAELAPPEVLPDVAPLVDSPHAGIRKAAAGVLAWAARGGTASHLRSALQHADPEVKFRAALGLAYLGDATVVPLVRSEAAAKVLTASDQFTAMVALGSFAGTATTVYLDHPDEPLRNRALLVLMLLELKDTDGVPEKCLECLSAKGPRFRLTGAQALEAFADTAAFREFVVGLVNDRGEDNDWKVTPEVVDDLANLLAFAPPQLKAKTAGLLTHFAGKEQAGWNQAWAVHSARFAVEINTARSAASAAGVPVPSKLAPAQLRELAFGGYVGLVREQGSGGTGSPIIKVRQTALNRVFAIASKDAAYSRAAQPVLAQAMGDPNQPVRTQAFEHLQALGMDRATLGSEALEAGYTDLGVKGLELLTDGTSSREGEAVLERVMLARTDDLATEAAKLLADRQGKIPTASKALDAVHEPLRIQAVQWLAAEYETSADAQMFLRLALESRYRRVRETAAFELAAKKDAAAFDALAKMLHDPAFAKRQKQLIDGFNTIADKRAAGVFLDRVETDPSGTAAVEDLVRAAADFRDPATADRLLGLADRKKEWQGLALRAARTVSGYDQQIADPEDENPDWTWEKDLHPWHDAVLAKVLDRAFTLGNTDLLLELLPAAQWSRGPDVDPVLGVLVSNPNTELRDAAVQAAGWRFRKRKGPVEPLLKAVRHKNPVTQFYAAEGLARGKRGEGLNVLLSSIEYLDDVGLRQRAVLALGELGDQRAVDTLLKLAGEDGHALQESAAEAIGHLKRSQQADSIFRLLERLAKGTGGIAQRAVAGLRWFDTPSGWDIVRAKLAGKTRGWHADQIKQTAADQLGYNDDPATRDLLLKVLRTEGDGDIVAGAFTSARRLWGKDSLEPHYHVIQNPDASDLLDGEEVLTDVVKTVAEKGDALRIMEVFPRCPTDVQEPLEAALLTRPNLPIKEAVAALAHADEGTVRLATRLLGRLPGADDAVKTAVSGALSRWWTIWQDRRTKLDRNDDAGESLDRATGCVESLLWAAGRVGVAARVLADVARSRPDDPQARSIRLEAARCLVAGKPSKETLDLLEGLAVGPDADVRVLAADLLARSDPKRAAGLTDKLLSDRPSFNRLVAAKAVPAARVEGVAGQVHYQPVVLPVLVAARAVAPLAAVAKDKKAAEAARLGAIEGLGVMADEAAEKVLVEVGTTKDDDKDVRKAAWRALRRSKRARRPKAPRPAVGP
ncbi:MAG: putative lyase [Gemmataceae bacterium]|nr:putative lyase [Gemmataceae bacterium]